MKRNERTTYNSLRKTVTADTINVEIPVDFTHEARQSIHELLTIEKHMRVSCIMWNDIAQCYCLHYVPTVDEYTDAQRKAQEAQDIDAIMATLPRTDMTWYGYKKTDEATEASTEATEQASTDPKNIEVTEITYTTDDDIKGGYTMERYDYLQHMTEDVKEAIRDMYTPDEIRERIDTDRDEFAQDLNDDLWTDDSVTGNASGSYYCNAWRAEEAIAHNWDLIADMIDEFDAADILRKGPEAIDVSIRCYLLGQAIEAALDELDDEIPAAAYPEQDDDTERNEIPA